MRQQGAAGKLLCVQRSCRKGRWLPWQDLGMGQPHMPGLNRCSLPFEPLIYPPTGLLHRVQGSRCRRAAAVAGARRHDCHPGGGLRLGAAGGKCRRLVRLPGHWLGGAAGEMHLPSQLLVLTAGCGTCGQCMRNPEHWSRRLLIFPCSNCRCRPRTASKTTRMRWLAAKLRAAKSRLPPWRASRRGPSGEGSAWQQLCSAEQ